jgi:hypothetical protein
VRHVADRRRRDRTRVVWHRRRRGTTQMRHYVANAPTR